jgi:hypothetical protein
MNLLKFKPQLMALFALSAIALFSYQNCADSVEYRTPASIEKRSSNPVSENRDVTVRIPSSPAPVAGFADTPEETDFDPHGELVKFECKTGVGESIDDLEGTEHIDTVSGIESALVSRSASAIDFISEIHSARTLLRAVKIGKVENIHSAIAALSVRQMGDVSGLRSAMICIGGEKIGRITDVESAYMKIRGRVDGGSPTLKELSGVHGFISIAGLDVGKISQVQSGIVVIRRGNIEQISDFDGTLALIDTKVKSLQKMRGQIILQNSSIESQSDVKADIIKNWPP